MVGVLGSIPQDFKDELELLPGVMQGPVVSKPYKLASREFHPDPTTIRVGEAVVGGDNPVIMAGICSVEDEEQNGIHRQGGEGRRGPRAAHRGSPQPRRGEARRAQSLTFENFDLLMAQVKALNSVRGVPVPA